MLSRLGVGEVLRLRTGSGPDGVLGEVHARPDGTLEVPGAPLGGGDAAGIERTLDGAESYAGDDSRRPLVLLHQ